MTVAITTVTCLTDVDGGTGLVGAVGALGAATAGCRLIDAVEVQILLKQTKYRYKLTYTCTRFIPNSFSFVTHTVVVSVNISPTKKHLER